VETIACSLVSWPISGDFSTSARLSASVGAPRKTGCGVNEAEFPPLAQTGELNRDAVDGFAKVSHFVVYPQMRAY
jgi:hypothetical protein